MELLGLSFIAIFLVKLYFANAIVDSSVALSLVEPSEYEEKDWKKSIIYFKGTFWKFQTDQMVQLIYTALLLLMVETGTIMYKNDIISEGVHGYRSITEANLLILITVIVALACNNASIRRYKEETIRIRELGNKGEGNVWAYMPGKHPNEEEVIEIRKISVENRIQVAMIYCPIWRKLTFGTRIQLSQRYIKYIFQCHPKLGQKLVRVRVGFAHGLQIMSNTIIVLAGLAAIVS